MGEEDWSKGMREGETGKNVFGDARGRDGRQKQVDCWAMEDIWDRRSIESRGSA